MCEDPNPGQYSESISEDPGGESWAGSSSWSVQGVQGTKEKSGQADESLELWPYVNSWNPSLTEDETAKIRKGGRVDSISKIKVIKGQQFDTFQFYKVSAF